MIQNCIIIILYVNFILYGKVFTNKLQYNLILYPVTQFNIVSNYVSYGTIYPQIWKCLRRLIFANSSHKDQNKFLRLKFCELSTVLQ